MDVLLIIFISEHVAIIFLIFSFFCFFFKRHVAKRRVVRHVKNVICFKNPFEPCPLN